MVMFRYEEIINIINNLKIKVKNERNGGMRTILTGQYYNEILDYIKRHGEVEKTYYLFNRNYKIIKKLKRNDKEVIEL